MARKRLSSGLRNLILREKKKNPYLSLRVLACLLADKHKINLSKSSIHNVLINKLIREKPGRKKQTLACQARVVEPCGLMLLKALDSQIGLFDYLTGALKSYFPKLDEDLLKRLIILASFSFFTDKEQKLNLRKSGLLRLVGLRQLGRSKVNYFNQTICEKHPLVSLATLKKDLKTIAAVKFYFKDGSLGFSDARLSTIWDNFPKLEAFFLPLRFVRLRLERMFSKSLLLIGYTRSFNYLSERDFKFAKGAKSGLVKLELLSPSAEVLAQLKPPTSEFSFFFGYSPQILTPPNFPRLRLRKFRRWFKEELAEFYFLNSLANFSSGQEQGEITLEHLQIRKGLSSSLSWGLLGFFSAGGEKEDSADLITEYFYLWPYIEEDFFKEIEIAEGIVSLGRMKADFSNLLPQKLIFSQPIDFIRIGQILSLLFKELIGGWEPKNKRGTFSLRKGYVKIFLKNLPAELKKTFNQAGFYLENRRVFLD